MVHPLAVQHHYITAQAAAAAQVSDSATFAAAGPGRQAEYLVKWLGKAHVHNEWVSRDLLLRIAKRKLMNFERRCGCVSCICCSTLGCLLGKYSWLVVFDLHRASYVQTPCQGHVFAGQTVFSKAAVMQDCTVQRDGPGMEGAGALCGSAAIAHGPWLGGARQVDAPRLRPVHLGGVHPI